MKNKDVVLTAEHPEAQLRHIIRGVVRRGLRPVSPKASVSLRIDADVLAWFKSQGAGYQTRMNAVLRAFKDASL
ncbi:MAG: BrnA antitoxin family protein [Proteobacteria bacterium]|nr:BrnA antitoxin family protein [Pseudomonadota bacterium]